MKHGLLARSSATLAFCFSYAAMASDLPDPRLTPGAIDTQVTQQNLRETVCVRGYTKRVRPPMYYTNALKKTQLHQYGYGYVDLRQFEEDHLVPLSIGGHPTDPRNLWPQPRNSQWGADQKDDLELVIAKMVCAGEITLATAQAQIARNWIETYQAYVPTHPQYLRRRGEQ